MEASLLRSYYARYHAENRTDDLDLAKLLASANAANPVESATEALTSDWSFELATSPKRNVGVCDQENWRFKASRQALIHWDSIQKIAANDQSITKTKSAPWPKNSSARHHPILARHAKPAIDVAACDCCSPGHSVLSWRDCG